MLNLFEIITIPLGYIIDLIYRVVENYGLSIIIFTIIVKLLLLPLNIKSQKAMRKQQKIQPILVELQKKYANDQQKLQQEMMKLYKDNDISMAGGCLPMLIQLPVLIGLYRVIQAPIKYLLHVNITDAGVVDKINNIVALMSEKFPQEIGSYATMGAEKLFKNAQIQLATWSEKVLDAADAWIVNFDFLGLNLSQVPSAGLSALTKGDFSQIGTIALLIIPALAVLTTWLSTKQTQNMSGQSNQSENEQAAQMGKSMTMMMPIMTGFFTISLPSGMGIYWIVSNVLQMIQQNVLNKYFDSKGDDFVVKVRNKDTKKRKKR
ncbi:MAG: YidC/Oxa1 family membrane protein insertase [Clostridia bacterium]|nr:YidC/Oxa1 family membrane protein insertase [Clostridia bacterium]